MPKTKSSKKDIIVAPSQKLGMLDSFSTESIDDYGDFSLTPKAKDRLSRLLFNTKVGISTASPIICRGGKECPFITRCPIRLADGEDAVYPLSRQCPVEVSFIKDKIIDYLNECNIEYEEAENSPTIRSLVDKLVSIDLYELRLSYTIAGVFDPKDATLLKTGVTSIQEGYEIEETVELPLMETKDRLHKQRMDILDALIATPKSKAKRDAMLKKKVSEDYVSKTMRVLESLEEIISKEKKSP